MKKESSLKTLANYAGKRRPLIYFSWVFAAISAILAFFPFVYIWRIIKDVLEVGVGPENSANIVHEGWMAFLFVVLSAVVYVASLMCSHIAAFRVATNIRLKLTHHILKLPLNFTSDFGSGNLRKIINDCSGATETYLAHGLPDQAVAYTTFISLIVLLLFFDWRLGLGSLLVTALAFVIMQTMSGKSQKEGMQNYNNALADMSNEAVEYVRGIPVVKTFGQTVFSLKKFSSSIERYQTWVIKYTKDFCIPMVLFTTIIQSVFAVLLIIALFVTRTSVEPNFVLNFIFYLILTPLISVTLSKIMYQNENQLQVNDALERINSVLDKKPLLETDKAVRVADYSVALKNLTYSYNESKKAVDNVTLKIESGKTVAFVGASGSGKSTIANLIARFFDPQEGKVLIGGIDAKEIPQHELMDKIAFVFQANALVKGSLLDNVRMGKPGASKEEVLQALELAQCMDIIEKFPNGVETIYGLEGVYLSGGEIQRIVIARAILKDAPILVLDEATSFADPDNEVLIQKGLQSLSKGKTTIMVAHRLSTVMKSDEIFVLDNGKLVEKGSATELLAKDGIFKGMWEEYQTAVAWKL